MHRSGTSAVSGTLTKLGGGSPKHLIPAGPENPKGFFESYKMADFHDELLESAGSNWRDWRSFNPGWRRSAVAADFRRRAKDLFAEEFDSLALPIFKDPRICRFAPFWLDLLREMQATPHIVMPIRSPLDVAQSLKRRNGLSITHGLLLWLRHVLDAEAQTRGEARSIFAWKDFQSDWRSACDKIAADTHLSWPRLSDRTSHEIERFLTNEFVHHDTDHAALAAHAEVHEWTLRAYEALLELARNPLSNSALATLDDVRALFDQSSKFFGRLLIDYEIDLEDARGQARAASGERDALRAHEGEILAQNAAALAELATRAEQAERARDEALRDKEALSRSLADSAAESAAALAELAARAEQAERARDEALRETAALSRSLADSAAESATALAELAARAEQAERARDAALREQEALSRSLADSAAENATGLAELAARAEQAERERDAALREKEALSRSLADSAAEQAALRREMADLARAHAGSLAALEDARVTEAAKEPARVELAGNLDRALEESQRLAVRLEQISSELQRTRDLASDLAASGEAALAKAQAEAQTAQEAQFHTLREKLVDAEAALASITAKGPPKGVRAWLTSAGANRRRLARRLLRSGLFDAKFYCATYPAAMSGAPTDGAKSELAAAEHYLKSGFCQGFRPNALFDTRWYLDRYEDVRRSGVNPLLHYLLDGAREGRDPGPEFHTDFYLEANPDVRDAGVNPLAHYLSRGRQEGRLAVRPSQG